MHSDFSHLLRHIKTDTPEADQARAANNVIARTIPDRSNFFAVDINFTLPTNTFRILKTPASPIVFITASSGVVACKAFYHYVKYYCNGHISWEGSQLKLPDNNLPDLNVEETSPSRFIYYQNVCTWSYSYAWWKWDDWQKHIDWMALNGISLTLAPVQELIWTEVYTELGLSNDEIDDHFTGPGFFAWQRMGNIRGWGGPITKNFKKKSTKLQRQIIHALQSLGIAVALPSFAGHVPIAFRRIYPNATLTPVQRWNRFPDQYCCPLYIDPIDPLFQKIGQMFLQKTIQRYGITNHIYFSDPFNEIQPRLADKNYLTSAAHGIYSAMRSVDEHAVWLLQGWMFVKNPFWSDDKLEAFLTAVPRGRMLVLDLQSEQSPQYMRTKSFYGQPFIWCMLHNFGGTLGMHGSVGILNTVCKYMAKSRQLYGFISN